MVSTVLVLVSDAVKDLKFEDKDKDLKSDDKDSKSEDKDFPRGQQHWFYRADKHTHTDADERYTPATLVGVSNNGG